MIAPHHNPYEQIRQWHAAGHIAEAKSAALQLLALNADDVMALHMLALLYAEENDLSNAVIQLEKAIFLKPDEPVLQLHLANMYKACGNYSLAETTLKKLIATHVEFAGAYNNLGTLYVSTKRFNDAIHAYQTAIAKQPNYIDAYYNLGMAHTQLQSTHDAMVAFEAVLTLAPSHPAALFQMGRLKMQRADFVHAKTYFLTFLGAYPNHFESNANLATCYLKLGDLLQAAFYYEASAALKPEDTQILFNLGVIAMQQNNAQRAIHRYLQVIALDHNHYAAHNNVSVAYLALENREAALLHFQEVLRLLPHDEAVQHTIDILKQDKNIKTSPPAYISTLFDSYAEHYEPHLKQTLNYNVPAFIYDAALKYSDASAGLSILDLGCGTGLCAEKFCDAQSIFQSVHIVGVDLSHNMLKLAEQKKLYAELVQMDIHVYLDTQRDQFDLIMAGDVMVYVGEVDNLFIGVNQALKSKGIFIFTTEATQTADYQLNKAGRFAHHQSYLNRLAEQNHFVICDYQHIVLRTQNHTAVYGHFYVLQKA